MRENSPRVSPPMVDGSPTSERARPFAIIPPRWLVGSRSITLAPAPAAATAATTPPRAAPRGAGGRPAVDEDLVCRRQGGGRPRIADAGRRRARSRAHVRDGRGI